jgi:diguanylate cyclase (GGDEF)-like protein
LILDVIDLRRINLLHGHAAGDEVLRHVAHVVKVDVHSPDVVFRYKGSQFLVLLSSVESRAAETLGRKISNSLSSRPFMLSSGGTVAIEVSLQCLSTPENGGSLEELLSAARVALPASLNLPETSSVH